MRFLALLALLWASAAWAQLSPAEVEAVTRAYPRLAELEWAIQQGAKDIANKAELAVESLGKQSTDEVNYGTRRLFLLRAKSNPRVMKALLLDETELDETLAAAGPAATQQSIAQLDLFIESMALKGSKVVTGGSIRPPPPPVAKVEPKPVSSSPDSSTMGGIGAVLLLGVAGLMVMSRRGPEPGVIPPESTATPQTQRDAAKNSTKVPKVIKMADALASAQAQETDAAAVAAAAAPPPGRARAVLESSSDEVNPMSRTQSIIFDQTAVFQPGQAPGGAGQGISKPKPPVRSPAVAPVAAGAPPGSSKITPPAVPATTPPAAQRPPPAAARKPSLDDSLASSKMNRTLPPYQPRGVPIRRAPKPPPAPHTNPVQVPEGSIPDRYRVLSVLGKGGMGVVYKAFDCTGKREVALKTLGAEVMSTDTARERFVREYETLNALDHPNIIKVYDMGCITTPYFAMEYASGEDLGSIMLDDNVSAEAVLEVGIQLSNALQYAHSEGVYHRDIKPSNLMITSQGLLKIVDFGLVKDTHASSLTMDGTVLGSLRFMAPEQLAAETVDARSDVYSIGMTLYYLLSGATPFDGHNPVVKLNQEPSSVLLHAPEADKRLAFAIDRCIRKDAKNRWQTAGELEAALRAIPL